jgi:DNA-binding NarL/FixJ family response regulator
MSDACVLIVDEDALLRDGLLRLLPDEPGLRVIAEVSGRDELDRSRADRVDLALVSSGLADGGFLSLCRELTSRCRVLVLSKRDHERTLMRALEAGAAGAVTTDASYPELITAVRAALNGEACVPAGMLGGLLRELIERRRRDEDVRGRYAQLSVREREVLGLLAAGEDVDQIARTLFISPQTVRSHIQRVLGKLEVHSRAEAVALLLDHELLDDIHPTAQGRSR